MKHLKCKNRPNNIENIMEERRSGTESEESTKSKYSKIKHTNNENTELEDHQLSKVLTIKSRELQKSGPFQDNNRPDKNIKLQNEKFKNEARKNTVIKSKSRIKPLTKEQRDLLWNKRGVVFPTTKFRLVAIKNLQAIPTREFVALMTDKLNIEKKHIAAITRVNEFKGYLFLINEQKLQILNEEQEGRLDYVTLEDTEKFKIGIENLVKRYYNAETQKYNAPAYIAIKLLKQGLYTKDIKKLFQVIRITEAEMVNYINAKNRKPENAKNDFQDEHTLK